MKEDDDREWKSSYDRFVEALEKVLEKQDSTSFGFSVEVSREELLLHLQERATHYAAETRLATETEPDTIDLSNFPGPVPVPGFSDPGHETETLRAYAKKVHEARIADLRSRAQRFAFLAKHLQKSKTSYVLSSHDCAELELVPHSTVGCSIP